MKKVPVPEPVLEVAKDLISSYGEGLYLLGKSVKGYDVYTYAPEGDPLIGAVRFLYKEGHDVIELHGRKALSIKVH